MLKLKPGSAAFFCVFTFATLTGCGKDLSAEISELSAEPQTTEAHAGNSPDETPVAPTGPVEVPGGAMFAIGAPLPQSLILGSHTVVPMRITAADKYAGNVVLTIERDELDIVDKSREVAVTFSPATLTLTPGATVNFNLIIDVKTSSRDFTNQHFHVVATEQNHPVPAYAVTEVPLSVKPIYEIYLMGGTAPEKWSSPTTPVNVRAHAGGVQVRFVNMDTKVVHTIHSSGAIAHQNTTLPGLAVATATAPGGAYEAKVGGTTPISAIYWCHSHEASASGRTINFNVNLP